MLPDGSEQRLREATFIVAAAGVGLACPPPAGPVQPMLALLAGEEQDRQQTPHFRGGHRDQAAVRSPPLRSRAPARVISKKA